MSNTSEIWVFLKKFFFKIGNDSKLAENCVSNNIISQKGHFHLNCAVLWQKNYETFKFGKYRKISNLEKLDNLMKEEYFLLKKRFHHLKKHPQQNWRVENMPVVAGRLVYLFFSHQLTSENKLEFDGAFFLKKIPVN